MTNAKLPDALRLSGLGRCMTEQAGQGVYAASGVENMYFAINLGPANAGLIFSWGKTMMRKVLLATAPSVTAMTAHANYQCSVTPRDDAIVSPQAVQMKGENGNLVIAPDSNVMYNGKQYSLNTAQRGQTEDYQAKLRSILPWIDESAKSRVEKARIALNGIIVREMGESSKAHSRLTKLDAQLKEQMNRITETRSDGLTFHYKAIDRVRTESQQLVDQAMGGILQGSINEIGTKAVLRSGGNPLQNMLGNLGGLQFSVQTEWKEQERDFQQFGKDVYSRVVTLEDDRRVLIGNLR